MTHLFKGAGVALITPFKTDYTVDWGMLERLVEDQIASGMDYLIALGTTAETPTLSAEEQREIVDCVRAAVNKRVPLMVGIGGNDPAKVIQTIQKTDFEGIDAILSVTPYYNKPSQEGLAQYFQQIAQESPVPVVLYNVPSRTGVNMLAETTLRIAVACPNVIAVKEAAGDCMQAARIAKSAPAQFALISGDDALALPMASVGGIGVISVIANALPAQLSQMIHLAAGNKYSEAREMHFRLIDMIRLIFREGSPAGVKALMEVMGKAQNVLRLPMVPVSRELQKDIEAELKKIV